MKRFPLWGGMGVVISLLFVSAVLAQDDAAARASLAEDLRNLNESIKRLTDRLDVLENNYADLQKQIVRLQTEIRTMSGTATASPKDIERLGDALKQLEAAREKDKTALVEQVAKMLDEFQKRLPPETNRRTTQGSSPPPSVDGLKHTVKAGENLTLIAKAYGVTIGELRRANQLTGDILRPGQVLVIPKKE
jgi:LysM repeat protein